MIKPRPLVISAMILGAIVSRLVPHPWNLTSVTAVALFSGACFSDRRLALAIPLGALFLSDLVLGFYSGMPVVYLAFALVGGIGMTLRGRRRPLPIALATLTGSILFFVVSNFGVWAFGPLYPHSLAGLASCYVNALPFFRNSLEGDALYSLVLFGGFALIERRFQSVREARALGAVALA